MTASIEHAATFGAHLRSWRMILGLTAEQVANRAEISRDTLSRLENGKPGAGFDIVLAVTRALGITDSLLSSVDPLNTDLGRARAHLLKRRRAR
jgi:transcriptional regulator with XRE-family HTH domain